MPKWKKRLTQREKAERAAIKKQLQADGVLPPDKPRLNRKKFAREVWEEFSEMETERFMQQLKAEGREQYSIGEYVEKVYNPVMNL